MVTIREKSRRKHGVSAVATLAGIGGVLAKSGARVALAIGDEDGGFTPVELLDAALAGCLALSIRYVAKKRGIGERAGAINVSVDHEKAADDITRIARFVVRYSFAGTVTAEERAMLIAEGHRLCTVSKAIEESVEIVEHSGE